MPPPLSGVPPGRAWGESRQIERSMLPRDGGPPGGGSPDGEVSSTEDGQRHDLTATAPAIEAEGRRGRSGRRTWPPSSPPATGRRPRGRGGESDQVALERGRLVAVIAGLLFMAGMRRSEVSALRWAVPTPPTGCWNPEGEVRGPAAGIERVTAHSGPVGLASEPHEPGGVDDRRDARRELEDEPDGGALQRRGARRTRGCRTVSLSSPPRRHRASRDR